LRNDASLYFIDMEYCPKTLEDHIYDIHDHGVNGIANDGEIKSGSRFVSGNNGEQGPAPMIDLNPTSSREEASVDFNFQSVADILDNVVSGLIYIHERGTVHRDLKPRNGMPLVDITDSVSSTLLKKR
jgi:serine/threonine protein kinase